MQMIFASWPRQVLLYKSCLMCVLNICTCSIANDLLFNPVKSVCIVFKPCRFKLYCPTVYIGTEPLTYVNTVKYLGFVFCENKKDDEDMLKQLRSLYAKSNKVIRMFNHCTVDVYVGGKYCHQTSILFTIRTKHIHMLNYC